MADKSKVSCLKVRCQRAWIEILVSSIKIYFKSVRKRHCWEMRAFVTFFASKIFNPNRKTFQLPPSHYSQSALTSLWLTPWNLPPTDSIYDLCFSSFTIHDPKLHKPKSLSASEVKVAQREYDCGRLNSINHKNEGEEDESEGMGSIELFEIGDYGFGGAKMMAAEYKK